MFTLLRDFVFADCLCIIMSNLVYVLGCLLFAACGFVLYLVVM